MSPYLPKRKSSQNNLAAKRAPKGKKKAKTWEHCGEFVDNRTEEMGEK